jgi:hypothetical protein
MTAPLAPCARRLLDWLTERQAYLVDVRDRGEARPLDTASDLEVLCHDLREALLREEARERVSIRVDSYGNLTR